MTSIFSDLYSNNIARIDSRSSTEKQSKSTEGKKRSGFAHVLADLEKTAKKTDENKGLRNNSAVSEQRKTSPNPPISNMSAQEQSEVRARLAPAPSIAINPPKAAIKSEQLGDAAVKNPSAAVNHLPPVAVLPPVSTAPQIPQVLSAKRLALSSGTYATKQRPSYGTGEIKDIISTAGKYHGVDPVLGLAVAKAESSYNSEAVSSDGHFSKGIFQLLDSTGKEMMSLSGLKEDYDPFDPGMNAFLGMGYLRRLMDIFSAPTRLTSSKSTIAAKSSAELEKLAVAAFNAGQGNVVRAQQRAQALGKDPAEFASIEPYLPASTRDYVARVTKIKQSLTQSLG